MRRLPAKALLLIALAACGGGTTVVPSAPVPVKPVIPRAPLSPTDVDTLAEIMRLEDRREFVAARFTAWLAMSHPEMRSRAALGAGRIGDRAATSLLLNALTDSAAEVRRNVAFALGELNDTSATVVAALTRVARQADSVGVEAVAALGKLATPATNAVIETLLVDATAAADIRREALLALWRFPRKANTLDLVLPFAASPDAETRWRAVYVLTRSNADPRAVPHLLRWITDSDAAVRAVAARGLRAATVDSAGQRAPARVALLTALRDVHPHVRINAVRSLGSLREAENVQAMSALLRDPDGNVALATAEALGENGQAEAYLAEVARSDLHIAVRTAALNALLRSEQGRTSAFQVARTRIGSPNGLERLFALRVLTHPANPSALEEARALINDTDVRVATTALNAVVSADTANPPYTLYIEKLAHADPGVRAAAIRGLQRRASPSDLELFLRAYDRALHDTQRYASQAAIDALGVLMRRGVAADRSFFLRFPKPADPLLHERIVARIGAGEWGPARPIDTRRDIGFYREVTRRFFGSDSAAAYPRARIRTAAGDFIIELNAREAPLTVLNFVTLAERGYFNNGRWHRVVPNFVLQDGDPRGDGSGGPGTVLRDEINRLRYTRGALGMALSGPDTGGSQFFITHSPQPHLDGGYTVFGRVISGMEIADRVVQDDPIVSIEVIR